MIWQGGFRRFSPQGTPHDFYSSPRVPESPCLSTLNDVGVLSVIWVKKRSVIPRDFTADTRGDSVHGARTRREPRR